MIVQSKFMFENLDTQANAMPQNTKNTRNPVRSKCPPRFRTSSLVAAKEIKQ